jgi:hypothetical protein
LLDRDVGDLDAAEELGELSVIARQSARLAR